MFWRHLLLLAIPLALLGMEDFELPDRIEEAPDSVTVDLIDPIYSDGLLHTEKGGVVKAPGMRIQARRIIYTCHDNVCTLQASDQVIIQYGDYIFVGDHVDYDFQTRTGVVYNGRTGIPPWFFGGKTIVLLPCERYRIEKGWITTSVSRDPEWKIAALETTLDDERVMNAKNVVFRFGNYTLFKLPRLKLNLDSIFESPISYYFRYGGRQGPRVGMAYEILNWNRFKTFLRCDYRLNRGPGGGLETYYKSRDKKERLETINYIARDSSIEQPFIRTRYRFQGLYHKLTADDRHTLDISWDKLSDKNFATDYDDQGLELGTAGRTQFNIRKLDPRYISNLLTRVRVNKFQTIKQELPTLETNIHPFTILDTGIVSDNMIKASYLDFEYADDQINVVPDFNSTRVEMRSSLYRPFRFGPLTATPFGGGVAIFYGNSPEREEKWATAAIVGGEVNSTAHRFFGGSKHVAIPYARYEYETFPTTPPDSHFIFDITDGQYRLNMLRFGMRNHLFTRRGDGCIHRSLFADIFANAFFDTPTIPSTIPKIYGMLSWLPTPRLRQSIDIAWDFYHGELDHINIRNEWTINAQTALALEYRHRDSYDWRKAQKQNFILDSYRSQEALLYTPLSDRRDTLLVHFFWRYAPTWAIEFESRSGWNRRIQPPYNEFDINIIGTLSSAWNITLSYRHKEDEDRGAIYFNVGINRPTSCRPCFTPCVEF